ADLAIAKIADPDPAIAGTSMTYTIVMTNQGTVTATNVVLSDTLPASTTLQLVDQTDDSNDPNGFGGGTSSNIIWVDPKPANTDDDEYLTLASPLLATGVFTSRILDAKSVLPWESMAWTPRWPSWKELPDNGQAETAYSLRNVNMVGNQVLLHLNEANGATTFADTSGLSNDVTCPAAVGESCPTAGGNGRFNQSLTFDGVDNTAVISDSVDPNRYAIELWVKPAVVTDTSFILRTDSVSGTAGTVSHLLGMENGRFLHRVNDGSDHAITSTATITAGNWYHIVGVAESGGEIKLFVNGVEEARLAGVGTLWTGGDQYRLGSSFGAGTTYFNGDIDEVAVYTRTLSTSEIRDHYLRGAAQLSFQVRSCDDALCAGESFVGPGGTNLAVYSEQSNTSLGLPSVTLADSPDNRYFQYRAILDTEDTVYAPELAYVQIGPNHYAIDASQGSCTATSASAFTCTLGSLAESEVASVTTQVHIHPSMLGVMTNTAVITTTSPDAEPANNSTFVTTTVEAISDLSVSKYDVEDPVNSGDVITYNVNIHNYGPSSARNITITDTLPFGGSVITNTWPLLEPGNYWSALEITYTTPISNEVLTNTVTITSTTPDSDSTNNLDTEETLVTPLADLTIEKFANPDPVDPGETLTYTVLVTNTGPVTATGVIVTDTLLSGLTGAGFGTKWMCNAPNTTLNCSLGTDLGPTDAATLYITVTAPVSGLLSNKAVVTADQVDPNPDDNRVYAYAYVRRVADLEISKTDTPDPVAVGAPLTYTITVTNNGPVAAGALTTSVSLVNDKSINIPIEGQANPYGSKIHLSSVEGLIQNITVTLPLTHTYPADVNVLLVGPGGQNVVLMANAGGGTDVGDSLVFNDDGINMPLSGLLNSAQAYRPTNYGMSSDFPGPAPAGPYGGSLASLYNTSPNGLWKLFVYDTVGSDAGVIAGGWSLDITAVTTDTVTVIDTPDTAISGLNMSTLFSGWTCDTSNATCETTQLPMGVPVAFMVTAVAPTANGTIVNTATITSTLFDPDLMNNEAIENTTVTGATSTLYLPAIFNNFSATPDLVVRSITAATNNVQVVIENQGSGLVTEEFWVDVYFNPVPPPSGPNQTIDTLGVEGVIWGVTSSALPLKPGETLTLTVGDLYYDANGSNFSGTIMVGTEIYAQVDSANAATTYGAVLETHELYPDVYNNIEHITFTGSPLWILPNLRVDLALKINLPKRP
ncbi:MAG: DUF11 domain-containing protein, partial [Chloroflexi bacterium]